MKKYYYGTNYEFLYATYNDILTIKVDKKKRVIIHLNNVIAKNNITYDKFPIILEYNGTNAIDLITGEIYYPKENNTFISEDGIYFKLFYELKPKEVASYLKLLSEEDIERYTNNIELLKEKVVNIKYKNYLEHYKLLIKSKRIQEESAQYIKKYTINK